MSLARVKVWSPGDTLTALDLNNEFNNVLNNPISLISPTTGAISFSTAQTFPLGQVVATSGTVGAVVSGSTASGNPLVVGVVVEQGTAPFQYASSVSLQLGLGVVPIRVGTQWTQRAVPAVITLSATSTTGTGGALVASKTYFVYAYDSTGTTTLDYATTSSGTGGLPHAPSTENGVEVASTDPLRTLVGMFRTNASTQFSGPPGGGSGFGSTAEQFVASWYRRRPIEALGKAINTSSFNRTTYAEHSSAYRAEFLTWGDHTVTCRAGGGDLSNEALGGFVFAGVGLDGGTSSSVGSGAGGGQSATAAARFFWAAGAAFTSSQAVEGYHFVTLATRVNTSTGTLASGTEPETATIAATVTI